MTTAAWVGLDVAAAFAIGNWTAVARGSKSLEYLCKPATMVALLVVALAVEPEIDGRRTWFVVALALSLAGDVFLMLPRDLFVPGLVAFLLGHIAYVVGLRVEGAGATAMLVSAVVVVVVATVVGTRIVGAVRRGSQSELTGPVVAYMAVISTMVTCALATGNAFAAAGAGLFFASDALIAWNRFVQPLAWAPVTIMVTYHLGQAGLVVSLVRS
jgi:uncharacterized membrane protein YhhN